MIPKITDSEHDSLDEPVSESTLKEEIEFLEALYFSDRHLKHINALKQRLARLRARKLLGVTDPKG